MLVTDDLLAPRARFTRRRRTMRRRPRRTRGSLSVPAGSSAAAPPRPRPAACGAASRGPTGCVAFRFAPGSKDTARPSCTSCSCSPDGLLAAAAARRAAASTATRATAVPAAAGGVPASGTGASRGVRPGCVSFFGMGGSRPLPGLLTTGAASNAATLPRGVAVLGAAGGGGGGARGFAVCAFRERATSNDGGGGGGPLAGARGAAGCRSEAAATAGIADGTPAPAAGAGNPGPTHPGGGGPAKNMMLYAMLAHWGSERGRVRNRTSAPPPPAARRLTHVTKAWHRRVHASAATPQASGHNRCSSGLRARSWPSHVPVCAGKTQRRVPLRAQTRGAAPRGSVPVPHRRPTRWDKVPAQDHSAGAWRAAPARNLDGARTAQDGCHESINCEVHSRLHSETPAPPACGGGDLGLLLAGERPPRRCGYAAAPAVPPSWHT